MKAVFIAFIALFSCLTIYNLWMVNLNWVFSSLIFAFLSFMGLVLVGFKNGKPNHLNEEGYTRDKKV